jgi:deuterolysin
MGFVSSKGAHPHPHPPELKVQLKAVGNSEVKMTISNMGFEKIKFLKEGTILDTAPVHKVEIHHRKGIY